MAISDPIEAAYEPVQISFVVSNTDDSEIQTTEIMINLIERLNMEERTRVLNYINDRAKVLPVPNVWGV